MNDDTLNKNNDQDAIEARHEPELEARLVAWIAGELTDFEAAELEQLVKARPELARFKARMELVREIVAEAAKPDAEPLRLSAERRAKLLKTLGADAEVLPLREQVVVLPPKRAWWRTARGRGTMIGAGMAAGLTVALFQIGREQRMYQSAVAVELPAARRPDGEDAVRQVQGVVDASVRSAADGRKVTLMEEVRARPARRGEQETVTGTSLQSSNRAILKWSDESLRNTAGETFNLGPSGTGASIHAAGQAPGVTLKEVQAIDFGPTTIGASVTATGQAPTVMFNVPTAGAVVSATPTFTDVGTRTLASPAVPLIQVEERGLVRGVVAQDGQMAANVGYAAAPGREGSEFSSTILTPRRPDPASTVMGPALVSGTLDAVRPAPTTVTFDVPEARPASNSVGGEPVVRPMEGLLLSTLSDAEAKDFAFNRAGLAEPETRGALGRAAQTISAGVAGFDSANVSAADKSGTGGLGGAVTDAFAFSLPTAGSVTLGAAPGEGKSVAFGGAAAPPPSSKDADGLVLGALTETSTLNLTSRFGAVVGGTLPAQVELRKEAQGLTSAERAGLGTVTGGMLADARGVAGAKTDGGASAQRAVAAPAEAEPVIHLQAFAVAGQTKKVAVGTAEPRARQKAEGRGAASALGAGELSAAKEAVSTFSLHVSDVSWRLMQAAIAAWGRGETPELPKVRVEEIYNAFDYGDPFPTEREKVTARIEQAAHPALQERNLVRIALRVAATGRAATQPLRLTVLLDTSGSMEREDRRAAVGRALSELVALLGAEDRVTLIGFARQPRLLAENVRGNQAGDLVRLALTTPPDGGTNLEEALKLAGELAARHRMQGAQNRIVLLTDGAANLGDAEPERLMKLVEGMRERGLAFDACGVGLEGAGDAVLEALTRKGDGRYYVLDRAETADATFARKLAGAFRPAAENVKVQVRFNPARVGAYRLIGFDAHRLNEADFRNDRVDAAELSAEEAAVAMYQVEPLPQGTGDLGEVSVRFRDPATGEMVERSWVMPYEPQAPALRRASPSMQLAGVATMLAEGFAKTPVGEAVELRTLAPVVGQLRGHFPNQRRVGELVEMFEQVRRMNRE